MINVKVVNDFSTVCHCIKCKDIFHEFFNAIRINWNTKIFYQ